MEAKPPRDARPSASLRIWRSSTSTSSLSDAPDAPSPRARERMATRLARTRSSTSSRKRPFHSSAGRALTLRRGAPIAPPQVAVAVPTKMRITNEVVSSDTFRRRRHRRGLTSSLSALPRARCLRRSRFPLSPSRGASRLAPSCVDPHARLPARPSSPPPGSARWTRRPSGARSSSHATNAALEHAREGHPESNARVPAILDALSEARLTPDERAGELVFLEGYRPATADEVTRVHTKNYVSGLNMLARTRAPLDIDNAPTYLTTSSYDAALAGVGAAIALVDAVVAASAARGDTTPAPPVSASAAPGPPRAPRGAMGFCLFGTVSAAARHAQSAHGLAKVLIFDYDVHHGNGTNDIFRDDPSVLFVSAHEDGSYPGTGKASDVGEGDGLGATINLPYPPEAVTRLPSPPSTRSSPRLPRDSSPTSSS